MKHLAALFVTCLAAGPLAAHPHVFVDTGLTFGFDDSGRLAEVKVTWAYDEFYSLLITEDMQLDADFDGTLTDDEQKQLTGFDMNWVEGFNGDLVIEQGDETLTMSGPISYTATLMNGRIVTTHVRRIEGATAAGPAFSVKPYDKTYYTAYDVTLPVTVVGSDTCRSRVLMPDITKGLLAVQKELATLDAQSNPADAGLPEIGAELATTVMVSCDVS